MARTLLSGICSAPGEREMNRHERGLVDTCFEEGQYEQGIASMDKLRVSHVKPPSAHIRQLVYIALLPPLPSPTLAEPSNGRSLKRTRSIMNSPSKIAGAQRDKQNRAAIYPTPSASTAAIRLLSNLVDCCTPASLTRALPGYPLANYELEYIEGGVLPKEVGGLAVNENSREEDDSFISRASAAISECKDCWELIRAGAVTRPDAAPSTTTIDWNTRSRRGTRRSGGMSDEEFDEESDGDLKELICERAWMLLDWLIRIWEKEEKIMEERGHGRWSPSLFSQIRPPRSGRGSRTEANSPLAVVFECLKSTSLRRQRLGSRLMLLLLNICTFPQFAHFNFLTESVSQLQSLITSDTSPSSSSSALSGFLSCLPQVGPPLSFKICVCDSLLNRHLPGLSASSRPAARRARPVAAISSDEPESPRSSKTGVPASNCDKMARLGPWTVPSTTRVLEVLESARNLGDELNAVQRTLLMHYLDAVKTYKVRMRGNEDKTDGTSSKVNHGDGDDVKFVTLLRDVLETMYEGWCT